MRETNWIRVIAQRLAKQNALYQLQLGSVSKREMAENVDELDRVFEKLANGRPAQWVPAPPTREIREQIERADARWGPLRTLALASPFDYLRRSEIRPRTRDPLLVRHFSDLCEALDVEARKLLELYLAECLSHGYPLCRDQAINGMPQLLSEQMVTALVLVEAGVDPEPNTQWLRESRDAYEATASRIAQVALVREATDPARGTSARAISEMLATADTEWALLRGWIDAVLAGEPVTVDFDRVLESQERMRVSMLRLNVAMQHFAAAQQGVRHPSLGPP